MALGRASHTAVFEPMRFLREYALFEGDRRAGKAWEAFKEQHPNKTILKSEEYDRCLAIAESVRNNPHAAEILDKGKAEQTITWIDPSTGLACKGRIDFISESQPCIADLKTTGDIDARRFSALAARMGYFTQCAWYRDGYRLSGGDMLSAAIIAVEKDPPFDVAVYVLDEDSLYAGAEEYVRLITRVRECTESGKWPGRYQEKQTLQLPAWCWDEENDTDATGLDLVIGHGKEESDGIGF